MLLVASAGDNISVQTFYISRLSRTYFSVTVYKLTVKQLRSRRNVIYSLFLELLFFKREFRGKRIT